MSRIHIGLSTSNLDAAIGFYQGLFGQQPAKQRSDYAKFEPAEPAVLLSLTEHTGLVSSSLPLHFGIQVFSRDALTALADRARKAGLVVRATEDQVTCCYAVSDKVWVSDPDGNQWELFFTSADAEVNTAARDEGSSCCATSSACCS